MDVLFIQVIFDRVTVTKHFFFNNFYFLGQNTKLSLNSRLTRNKMSSSEKFVNKFLIFFLLLLIAIVTVSYFLKR